MKILGFDVTLAACSACLWQDGQTVAARTLLQDRGQAQSLVPLIQQVMTEAGWCFDNLDLIGVTTGPGGFTGVRIGLATARGFGLSTGRPVIGLSTFDAIAHSVPNLNGQPLAVAIDSRREDIFVQLYRPDCTPEGEPFTLGPGEAGILGDFPSLTLAGDAAEQLAAVLSSTMAVTLAQVPVPDPSAVARLAAARVDKSADYPPLPLYLRAPDARLPEHAPWNTSV